MSGSLSETQGESGRVQRVLGWLRERSDRSLVRLTLRWFRAYFTASRNSGCAISLYSSLSVLPAAHRLPLCPLTHSLHLRPSG